MWNRRNQGKIQGMDNIACFIDELYFYNKQKNLYMSKYATGNFLKLLKKELNVNIAFMFPVAKGKTLNSYSTLTNPNEYIVESLPHWDSITSYYGYLLKPRNYSYLKTKMKEIVGKYDIFWIRIPSPFGLWLGKEAEKNGKFVIYNVAGDIRLAYLSERYTGIKKRLAKFMGNYLYKKSLKLGKNAVFLCIGSTLLKSYEESGRKAIYFIHSLIRKTNICKPKSKISDPIKFLYVGKLLREKGIFFLMDALEQLKHEYSLELHIAGFGKDEKQVHEVSKNKDFIKFYGFVPYGDQLLDIYKECDVLILPTINYPEGFPRVILEAWANGLFVISSNVGGIKGLGKDKKNILFFQAGDKLDFLNKARLLITDKSLQFRIRQGIKEVQKFITFECAANTVKNVLNKEETLIAIQQI